MWLSCFLPAGILHLGSLNKPIQKTEQELPYLMVMGVLVLERSSVSIVSPRTLSTATPLSTEASLNGIWWMYFSFDGGLLANLWEDLRSRIFKMHFFQSRWHANLLIETNTVQSFFGRFSRIINQGSIGYFFTVSQMAECLRWGLQFHYGWAWAAVNPSTFKSNPTKKAIGFNDVFRSRSWWLISQASHIFWRPSAK